MRCTVLSRELGCRRKPWSVLPDLSVRCSLVQACAYGGVCGLRVSSWHYVRRQRVEGLQALRGTACVLRCARYRVRALREGNGVGAASSLSQSGGRWCVHALRMSWVVMFGTWQMFWGEITGR
jgi:hypothetical protein